MTSKRDLTSTWEEGKIGNASFKTSFALYEIFEIYVLCWLTTIKDF
jgi:hypothetical protein